MTQLCLLAMPVAAGEALWQESNHAWIIWSDIMYNIRALYPHTWRDLLPESLTPGMLLRGTTGCFAQAMHFAWAFILARYTPSATQESLWP